MSENVKCVVLCSTCMARERVRDDQCYRCYLKSVSFNYGHLRNRLYPGEPIRNTEKTIRAEAQALGEDAVPADWA